MERPFSALARGAPDRRLTDFSATFNPASLREILMIGSFPIRGRVAIVAALALCVFATAARATVVRISTTLGNIDLRMYEGAAPQNVANFLNYMNSNRYDGTFIHRSIPGFVIQGGGYKYDQQSGSAPHIEQFAQVMNEPGISNLRGTIAMAKLSPPPQGPPNGGPDSATSEWFLNLSDNSGAPSFLDTENGGYTVFGRIVFTGLTTMDNIAALPTADLDPGASRTFDTVPLRDGATLADRFVYVNDVFIRTAIPAADYNFDAAVTIADYNVWKSNYGSTTNAGPDGDGNGIVDTKDYIIWRNAFVAGGGSVASIEGVPEAGSAVLSLLAAAGLISSRRRRRAVQQRLRSGR
jgi:cyclophilin family peptidyl-prolyl cis-trans isomerase